MRIGMVISGGDVSGINNFIFQLARMTHAEMVLFNGGIPGLLTPRYQEMTLSELLDFSITAIPVMQSGRTEKNSCAVSMKLFSASSEHCVLMC